ncbi:hypothetical protein [Pseudomonas sp.]|uniref:hypothetical protein n=1 Tax=Pseudomonas sp. TaxID=306 RepID=UPI003BB5E42A
MKGKFNTYDEKTGEGTITAIFEPQNDPAQKVAQWEARFVYNFRVPLAYSSSQSFRPGWDVEFDPAPIDERNPEKNEAINLRF